MKKVLMICLLVFCSSMLHAQVGHGEGSFARIAQTLKDSLSLSNEQIRQIHVANVDIHVQKQAIRQKYKSVVFARTDKPSNHISPDSLGIHMYNLELKRDSLYKVILPLEKYELYQQKKGALVNSH